MRRFVHIVNPVAVDTSSDLYVAQPITFHTMEAARRYAEGSVDVSLFSAQFAEDRAVVPPWLAMTRDMDRSVLEMGTFVVERKLPLLKDILDRAYDACDADYCLYTNVDIGLLPSFYSTVDRLIARGYDAFVITRRTISADLKQLDDIPLMVAQLGRAHPGYDCFAFRRKAYPDFYLGSVCIGASWVGKTLMMNLMATADNFELFRDLHVTFHIGDDRAWTRPELRDYTAHNERELHKVLQHFGTERRFSDHPLFRQHIDDMRRGRLSTDRGSPLSAIRRAVRDVTRQLRGSHVKR